MSPEKNNRDTHAPSVPLPPSYGGHLDLSELGSWLIRLGCDPRLVLLRSNPHHVCMARIEHLTDLFGEPIAGTGRVALSARERATMARAATILHAVRELSADADDDFTTDVALAAYVCDDLAENSRWGQ